LNVVRLADSFQRPPNLGTGLAPTVYYLSESQASLGLKIHVVCRHRQGEKQLEKTGNIEVHRVSSPFSINMLNCLLRLNALIKPEIIHTHATTGWLYALTRKLSNHFSGKLVAHVHGTTKGIISAWKRTTTSKSRFIKSSGREISVLRESLLWRNADGVVTISQFLKKELVELYRVEEDKIHVIYNGADLQVFHPIDSARKQIIKKHGLGEKSKLFLYLGGNRLVKGPQTLLEAFNHVCQGMSEIALLFVEKAFKNAMPPSAKKILAPLEARKAILFLDTIPYFDLPSYYSAVDAVIVPSVYDALPKVVLEALACKTPVVASNTGGIPEIISNKKTGLLFEPGNSADLAEAIVTISTDSKLREKMRAEGRKLIEEKFTWEKVAERSLKAYHEILGK